MQDLGSALVLDGERHRRRKQLFLSLTPSALGRLGELALEEWRLAIERWSRGDHVLLLEAAEELLCRTVARAIMEEANTVARDLTSRHWAVSCPRHLRVGRTRRRVTWTAT